MDVDGGTSGEDGKHCVDGVQLKREATNNGFGHDAGDGSSGASDVFLTYKRRRHGKSNSGSKLPEGRTALAEAASQFADQSHWRNAVPVLQKMYKSLRDTGAVQDCIRDTLSFHQGIDSATMAKEYDTCTGGRLKRSSQMGSTSNGTQYVAKEHTGVLSNGSTNAIDHRSCPEMCMNAFSDILVSEKFNSLCKLLVENFQGVKGDSLFNLSLINSRMKEGAYEQKPELFSVDVQQVWRQLEMIGTEMSSLAKSLSDLSVAYCNEHIRKSGAKLEQTEAIYKVCICRFCGTTADGRDCLVCDSCEEMYHVSCIEPAVKEVPPKSWYCSVCTGKGIGSPHENCELCERLSASLVNQVADDISPRSQRFKEFDENSNVTSEDGHRQLKGNEECKICRSKLENGDEFRICDHALCDYKYYHTRCLTIKQLKSHCPHWYCPSCLCRICLTDKDDDQIVLCDACDEAYHTYCMSPPRSSIPKGKWFCVKCHSQIQQIRRVRRAYEKLQNKAKDEEGKMALENSENEPSENGQTESDKCGVGMDMLLNAANTLNYEEKVPAVRM
ncbi:RING/FYVE/PHD-type zinc finger family protein putative isoform 1 [Tripterygium wilfordii]|uniref:RING/FYVE/PHD-type zinc finger family protein putative isoform 1 n=1 Tax=Tripterygium wilfordii TaxID=458696 RepID=A0A7J7DRU0_TRIWF|nr:PHD finger protein EHD3-like [Tripterygium wilfordii]XP_038700255.1 PHD finger protein EHD3-like [Tripterygium wilfordii]KAF5749075.1 RING/FYVE/PHD-type zinc finger family protein putative isoform 1 [Tripterygium wilfordii]